jgi:hypothetical protein
MTTHYPVEGVLGPTDLCETDEFGDGDLTLDIRLVDCEPCKVALGLKAQP